MNSLSKLMCRRALCAFFYHVIHRIKILCTKYTSLFHRQCSVLTSACSLKSSADTRLSACADRLLVTVLPVLVRCQRAHLQQPQVGDQTKFSVNVQHAGCCQGPVWLYGNIRAVKIQRTELVMVSTDYV